jgi:hypothetical protein
VNPQERERRPAKDAAHEVTATKQDVPTIVEPLAPVPGLAGTPGTVPPVVDVLKVSATRDGNRTVTIRCPWCGRRHMHGLPADNATVGHRVAHCDRDVAHLGYVVVLTPVGVSA